MTQILGLSTTAQAWWDNTASSDPKLAEALDKVFDDIENGERRYQQYDNHARFTTFGVPGRDDQYMVVWDMEDEGPLVVGIGKV